MTLNQYEVMATVYTSVEICAGAGGQALGLEQAGFHHQALVELDAHACETLRRNRPNWNVLTMDVRKFPGEAHRGVDLLAAGIPCPPFSVAGKQLGQADERDLFPEVLRLVEAIQPNAVMVENVRGLLDGVFDPYRQAITRRIESFGYQGFWTLLQASDFGVPQLRPRALFVALRPEAAAHFRWPVPFPHPVPTVGEVLYAAMRSEGWEGADAWRARANQIAPTLVGGSKKHGGPDLGPTRAKQAWVRLGVDGHGIADAPPGPHFEGFPRLTVAMAARLQGFPPDWTFVGKKTPAYRQVGNAFPPPVARAVGIAIREALTAAAKSESVGEGTRHAGAGR